jgi:excisionase family DNA binding protein
MESIKLFTLDEVAERLHLGVVSIRDLVRLGELKAVFNGRAYLVTEAAIGDYITANTGRLKLGRKVA